jgi:transcription elongation factor GreA
MDRVPITIDGYNKIQEELRHLKFEKRPAIINAIAEARALGDLSENAEYHAAREQQSLTEARISELESVVSRAEIIDITKFSGPTIRFGAQVTMIDEETEEEVTYRIVGEYESDLNKRLISISSPVARGLIGKNEGDYVEIQTPRGIKEYEIIKVVY